MYRSCSKFHKEHVVEYSEGINVMKFENFISLIIFKFQIVNSK